MMCRAGIQDILQCRAILHKFCNWSGQEITFLKSGLHFSRNTAVEVRREIKQIIGMRKLKHDAKYLGNPLFLKRKGFESFQFIVEKIKSKLASWKAKTLSWVGSATLIRSSLSSVPNYTMSLYRLPKLICRKIDQLSCKFWWENHI